MPALVDHLTRCLISNICYSNYIHYMEQERDKSLPMQVAKTLDSLLSKYYQRVIDLLIQHAAKE
jgi:hypothetical protein